MTDTSFGYTDLFAKGLPEPAVRFTGFPKYNFTGGHNDLDNIPVEALARAATRALTRDGQKLAMYNLGHGPLGYRELRSFVANKLKRHRGIDTTIDNVLVLSGSGQGLDLINRIMLDKGDTVIVEELTYGVMPRRIRALGVNIVALPLDEKGLVPEKLANILADLKSKGVRPKYIYTIPTIQNPTGSILPLDRRQQMVKIAREYGVPIFEDECYADLIWAQKDAPPALYALDPDGVIHLGSFSKTLAPALRVGYCVANWAVLSRLIACKSDGGTGALDQMTVAEYFGSEFEQHIETLSGVLREKRETMVEALEKEFGTSAEITDAPGGIYVWVKLPDAVDVTKLVGPAGKAGVAFNPGPEWSVDTNAWKSHMRLCFALPSKDDIRQGIAELARVCYEQTGIPPRSGNVARS